MHNGWTNYATWRINLEIFDDLDSEVWAEEIEELSTYEFSELLKEHTEQLIITENELAESYAYAFISQVNFSEIAEHIIETYSENYCCDNCNDKIDERYMSSYCSSKCAEEYELLATHSKG